MPANLSPDYYEAERQYREATTPQEKLAALELMLRCIPKHKGTEKMQADLRRRISKERKEGQKKKKAGARHKPFYQVDKDGAGQVVLVGPPNAGKSRLLDRLTNAHPEVAEYPFTTRVPLAGMVPYGNVNIQLVDLPPVAEDWSEPWLFGIIRNADAVLLVVDASDDDVPAETDELFSQLEGQRIRLVPPGTAPEPGDKTALMVAAKCDSPRSRENVEILQEFFGDRLPLLEVSAQAGVNLERLTRAVYDALGVIRVYTKTPGKPANRTEPFVLRRGSTVLDAARTVHRDFTEKLRFARIWGSERFDGQKVSREHVLEDEDVIELHLR
jgi:ribosome-interacting GTPase 1